MKNSFMVAVLATLFTTIVLPPTTVWLARKKYNISGDIEMNSSVVIAFFTTQTSTALVFEVFIVLISPMLAVLMFDESQCHEPLSRVAF